MTSFTSQHRLQRLSTLALLMCACTVVLTGCATPAPEPTAPPPAPAPAVVTAPPPAPEPVAPAPAPVVATPAVSPGAASLRDGTAAFSQGEYKRAEAKLLESQKLGLNQSSEQLQAHKTKAFLYCVTRRTALCEKSFADAFATDKGFDLTRAERGHPVWGPVFARVQKRQRK
jgi:hypothetical protein